MISCDIGRGLVLIFLPFVRTIPLLCLASLLLELMTLTSKGCIRLNISLESFLREVEARFIVLPISGRACVRALRASGGLS